MKIYLLIFGLVFIQNSFCQERYVFDYYTVYEYKEKENDVCKQIITFSNSINSDYKLSASIVGDSIKEVYLRDNKNDKNHSFKKFSLKDIENGLMFNNSSYFKNRVEYCNVNPNNVYETTFESINGIKSIHIIRYKNKRKKKIINESFYETEPTEITKIQHYNMPVLSGPLWCQRFNLNENVGVITNTYFIENGIKIHFWRLKEITKTDFTININIEKETEKNE